MNSFFDFKTIFVALCLTMLTLSINMIYYIRSRHIYPGFQDWTIGTILITAAFLAVAFRGALSDFITIIMGNLSAFLGTIFFYFGFKKFTGQKTNYVFHIIGSLICSAGIFSFFTYVRPNFIIRVCTSSFFMGVYFMFCFLMVYRYQKDVLKKNASILNGTFLSLSLLFLVRGIYFLHPANHVPDFSSAGLFSDISMLVTSMLCISFVMGFIQLNTQKLELELSEEKENLRQNEEKYHSLSDAAFEGIAMTDKGAIIEANKKLCRLFGYDEDELMGMKAVDLVIPKDRDKVKNNILSGSEHVYDVIGLRKEGTTFPLEIQGKMFDARGRQLRVASLKDITKRVEAEKELQESQRQYRQLVEDIGPSSFLYSHRMDGVVTYVSPSAGSVIGLDRKNVIGKSWMDLLNWEPESIERGLKSIQELTGGKEHATFEVTFWDKTESKRTLLVQSHLIRHDQKQSFCIEGLVTDITDRKRAENERERLIRELQDALENISTLSGLLPICARCKKIRDDKGYWNTLEAYIEDHSDASFSHSLCEECSDELYGNQSWYLKMKNKNKAE
ncbi:MAG: PAS domain S-box protein [Desulfobacter sp.]|nr:MAG: PAS domain S-box protein [Desulfobacter sp.]